MRALYQQALKDIGTQFDAMFQLSVELFKKSSEEKIDLSLLSPMNAQLLGMEKTLYQACERLILKEQPVAHDLKFLMGVLRKIPELRRIGELSLNSAKILEKLPPTEENALLEEMKFLLLKMFAALEKEEGEMLNALENQTDSAFKAMQNHLAQKLEKSPQNAPESLAILMLSKYYEKIADHIIAFHCG